MKKIHTLIIGGSRGIGGTLAAALAKKGQAVSVISRQAGKNIDPDLCGRVHYQLADITDKKQASDALRAVLAKNGALDNLVFFQRYRGLKDSWEAELETSLSATKRIIESLADKFEACGNRSIVIAASIAAFSVAEEQPLSYHVAKAGLVQMARYYAVVLGKKGIRVNSVSSGTIVKDEARDFYAKNKALKSLYQKVIPLGRMGTARDIAEVVMFLCSRSAGFITGQNIVVDGGASLAWQESLARKLSSLNKLKVTR